MMNSSEEGKPQYTFTRKRQQGLTVDDSERQNNGDCLRLLIILPSIVLPPPAAFSPMADYAQRIATEWHQRAEELANWVMARMVNRTDVWGRYVRKRSDTGEMGVVTAPFRDERGKVFLDEDSLKKHF